MTQEAVIKSISEAVKLEETLEQAVARLAALSPLAYDRVREHEAEKLGVRVSTFDKEVEKLRQAGQEDQGMASLFPDIEPWPHPVCGADLLNEIYATVRRFIVCDDETSVAATLWIAFSWFIDHVKVAPLAIITAPEKRCGKSQLLSLIGLLSRRSLVASNISPAAIFRTVEAYCPTLLIDEADTFLRNNEEARGIINSGHTRQTAYVIRVVGEDHEPTQFSTWGAKVICGIGSMPETLMDRAILLKLRRKLPHEKADRLRHVAQEHFQDLSRKLARFAQDIGKAIGEARPALPDALNDRAQDNWEPLFAIADQAGDAWPDLARKASLSISGTAEETVSLSLELLTDIRDLFTGDRMSTKILLEKLTSDDEKPWATYNKGKPMTPRQLSKCLAEYGIKAQTIRIGCETPKGFLKPWFEDAFRRYLDEKSATAQQMPVYPDISEPSDVADNVQRCGSESPSATPNPLEINGCCSVADLADQPEITV